jgi:hypothetical protein
MKFVLLLFLLLLAGIAYTISVRRRIARDQAAAALARARAARRPKVPAVSSNLKGVTASQTIQPFRSKRNDGAGDGDERAA